MAPNELVSPPVAVHLHGPWRSGDAGHGSPANLGNLLTTGPLSQSMRRAAVYLQLPVQTDVSNPHSSASIPAASSCMMRQRTRTEKGDQSTLQLPTLLSLLSRNREHHRRCSWQAKPVGQTGIACVSFYVVLSRVQCGLSWGALVSCCTGVQGVVASALVRDHAPAVKHDNKLGAQCSSNLHEAGEHVASNRHQPAYHGS